MASFARVTFFADESRDLRPNEWKEGEPLLSRSPSPSGYEPHIEEERPLTPVPLTPEKKTEEVKPKNASKRKTKAADVEPTAKKLV